MTRLQARETAREILEIIPLVMRTVAAELRAAGEMPAPAHFGLLSILSVRPRMLTDLASIQGVSLPTMSNSISAMVERGWVRREAPDGDRRVVMIDVTPTGRAAICWSSTALRPTSVESSAVAATAEIRNTVRKMPNHRGCAATLA